MRARSSALDCQVITRSGHGGHLWATCMPIIDQARAWYERFDFEPSPTDPFHLFLLLKDQRAALAG